jgi:hypothetical protein
LINPIMFGEEYKLWSSSSSLPPALARLASHIVLGAFHRWHRNVFLNVAYHLSIFDNTYSLSFKNGMIVLHLCECMNVWRKCAY